MNLQVVNGTFAYKGAEPILRNINLDVQEGELIAVLGPNGVGKTTLLKCLLGLLRWKSGQTLLNGEDIREIPERSFWQQIAYVPQARGTANSYTVEEMLLLGRASRIGAFRTPGKEDLQEVDRVLERLHIENLRTKRCNRISGGELQMVLIGRALVSGAGILVLDEPESNLDFRNQLIVLDMLESLSREGKSCIFNTHYPAHALQRADRSLLLDRNGSSLFGETQDVITQEHIQHAFGVRSLIQDITTEQGVIRDVIPIEITGETND